MDPIKEDLTILTPSVPPLLPQLRLSALLLIISGDARVRVGAVVGLRLGKGEERRTEKGRGTSW
jgi:hypothetical protein